MSIFSYTKKNLVTTLSGLEQTHIWPDFLSSLLVTTAEKVAGNNV